MALTTVVPECDQEKHRDCSHRSWHVSRFGREIGTVVQIGESFEARLPSGRYVGQTEARHLAVEQLREF